MQGLLTVELSLELKLFRCSGELDTPRMRNPFKQKEASRLYSLRYAPGGQGSDG